MQRMRLTGVATFSRLFAAGLVRPLSECPALARRCGGW
jgi:hypothetical protein